MLGADRILFGTDGWTRDATAQIAQVSAAPISDAERRLVFRENAIRWLKLTGSELPQERYDVR